MLYHAPTKNLTVSIGEIESLSEHLLYAISNIRKMANLPLEPYKRSVALTNSDHAQKAIIDAAKSIGIDLCGNWGNELNVSKYQN